MIVAFDSDGALIDSCACRLAEEGLEGGGGGHVGAPGGALLRGENPLLDAAPDIIWIIIPQRNLQKAGQENC